MTVPRVLSVNAAAAVVAVRSLCASLELSWQPSMLHWAPGPKPYDGVWAPWWYANTHKSTGFDFGYR
jgi:branched-chain amino acid aminotransferase